MKRSELYAAIWAEPVSTLATRLGCSGTWLGAICKKLSVPQPPRGFWSRVHGRHTVQRPPLPPGEDVDIGFRVQIGAARVEVAAPTRGAEPAQLVNSPADHGSRATESGPCAAARCASAMAPPFQHDRGLRQLYRDAKEWRRHREVHDFLCNLASNAGYREPKSRAVLLRWIELMREDLTESDPLRACIQRVLAFGDSGQSRH